MLTGSETRAEQLEHLLWKYVGLENPHANPTRRAAFDYCLERWDSLQQALHFGLTVIPHPNRRARIREMLGKPDAAHPEDYGFNVWVADQCMGTRVGYASNAIYRCKSCHKLRTNGRMNNGFCKCGGSSIHGVAAYSTAQALRALALGY